MSLNRESPFRHKVVYSLDDGCSLRQKSIHHERENTMLFSSILVVNGRLFLRCSIVCRKFVELIIELSSKSLWVKINVFLHWEDIAVSWIVLKIYLFPVLHLLIKCLVTKLRTNRNVCQVLYVNSSEKWTRNEKYWIKTARGRSNLCLSRIFILFLVFTWRHKKT